MHRHLAWVLAAWLAPTFAVAAEPAAPPRPLAPAAAPAAPEPQPALTLPRIAGILAGERTPPPRTVTVTGRAVGYLPMDTIIWTISLETTGKDVTDVKKASDQQVKTVTDACKAKGVQPADIDPGLIRIVDTRLPETGAAGDPQKPILAARSVTVLQRDVTRFNDLLEVLGRDKNNRIRYVFACSTRDDVMRDTVTRATQAARDKATAMATVAGAQLGRPLTIDEYAPPKLNIPDASVPVDRDTPAFGADAQKVIMTVYVTFELQ